MAIEQDTLVRVLVKDRAKLLAYIWAIVSDVHTAEDVLSDVTVLAVKKREQITDEAHLAGWLRVVARTEALKALRTQHGRATPMSDRLIDLLDAEWARRDGDHSAVLAAKLNQRIKSVYVAISRVHRALGDCIRAHQAREAR